MNIKFIPIFRQKIANSYHFDFLAINEKLESFTVGYVIVNSKTGETNCLITNAISKETLDVDDMIEGIKENIIVDLERIFSDQ